MKLEAAKFRIERIKLRIEQIKVWVSIGQIAASAVVAIAIFRATNTWERTKHAETLQLEAYKQFQASDLERQKQQISKRIQLWDTAAPTLNRIYAYFMFQGKFKEYGRAEVVKFKREADEIMYANRLFFSDSFFNSYEAFMKAAFEPNQHWLKDAALRTQPLRPKDSPVDASGFTNEDNRAEVSKCYYHMQQAAAAEFALKPVLPPVDIKPLSSQAKGSAW
jgi:hypothetical protein